MHTKRFQAVPGHGQVFEPLDLVGRRLANSVCLWSSSIHLFPTRIVNGSMTLSCFVRNERGKQG